MPDRIPPAWLERLIAALIGPGASTRYIIGDLREEYRGVCGRGPTFVARLWYVVQGVRVAARVRLQRRHTARAHGRSSYFQDIVRTDVRQSIRFLLRRPVLSGSITLTVALAVAATTSVFAVVDGVLLEPLRYVSPERLAIVWETAPQGERRSAVSPANFLAWRDELESFDAMASLLETSTTMIVDGVAERVGWVQASAAYFEIVGAEAVVGRLYGEAEDQPGAGDVVVLSEDFWRRRFGSDPAIVGGTIQLGLRPGGWPVTVLGVLADRFDFDVEEASFGGIDRHDVWLPPAFAAEARQTGARYLQVVARLAPGATVAAAQQEGSTLALSLSEAFPDRQRGWGVNVVPLHEEVVGDVRSTIFVVFGAVCFVLLIACANVANLLTVRASEREQEMTVRAAMGAGRGRLVRQLLGESALLSLTGGVFGALLAQWAITALVRAAPEIPRLEEVGIDGTVLGFSLLTTCGVAFLFGLAPAHTLGRPDVAGWLGARGTAARREARRLRGALVVVQVALSLVLLVGAGLLVRSLVNRLGVGVGFDVEHLVTTQIQLGGAGYDSGEQTIFFEELVDRVSTIPGVSAVSAITWPPLAGGGSSMSFWPLDRPVPETDQLPEAEMRSVHRDYHRVAGIPVLAGRSLGDVDRAGSPLVVLVSASAADRIWPGESPLGKRIALPGRDTLVAEVVGVVGDVRHEGPDVEPSAMFYWEHRQFRGFNLMSLIVRTEGLARATLVSRIQAELAALDPAIPLFTVHSMEELFADATRRARLATISLGLFALVALVLAAIGIYGVVAHATARRSQEIGIRMALGAARPTILSMVLREGMTQVAIAIVVGTVGALALSRVLQGLVFDVSTTDPLTFLATVALLATIGFVASWLPARRASGIDPMKTIRSE